VESATNSQHYWEQNRPFTAGAIYTVSYYAKAAEKNSFSILFATSAFGVTSGACTYTLSGDGAATVSGAGATGGISSVGNGWYRCWITQQAIASVSAPLYTAFNGLGAYLGDGTSGIYIFGAQLSDSASVDPYVYQPVAAPTSTAYYGPRFDYDPVTLAPKGLLIEEQRANLILQSENFSASWSLLRMTNTADALVSPDGRLTADLLLDTAVAGTHVAIQIITKAASSIVYTASVYLKAGVRTLGELRVSDQAGNGVRNTFNLAAGTVGTPSAFGIGFTAGTSTITSVGNGWYRVDLVVTSNIAVTLGQEIYIADGSGNTSYTGNGSGFYAWGAQLEAGAFATSYIPTVASQVTRAADSASMIGNNFARWFTSPNAYSVFSDYIYAGDLSGVVFTIDVGQVAASANDYSTLPFTSTLGTIQPSVKSGGVVQATNTFSTLVTGASAKTAYAVTTNNFIAANNGTLGTIDTSVVMPSLPNSINFGLSYNFGQGTFWLKRFASYSRVLSSVELQGITS
jgi:hypothetical protein